MGDHVGQSMTRRPHDLVAFRVGLELYERGPRTPVAHQRFVAPLVADKVRRGRRAAPASGSRPHPR